MAYEWENSILPEFPRTEHLPALGSYTPNVHREDLIADPKVAAILKDNPDVTVEEKVDAANSGICHYDGQPIIRTAIIFSSKVMDASEPMPSSSLLRFGTGIMNTRI